MTQQNPTIDELFRVVMLDIGRKVKISIHLKTEDGDDVPIRESISKITEYVGDKLKHDGENECKQMIMPLMAQSMVGGLDKLLGTHHTCFLLSQEDVRYSVMHMMTASFYFMKWMQKQGIKIHAIEEPVTDEEISMYQRINKASSAAMFAQTTMGNGVELLKEMLRTGQVTQSDLEHLGMDNLEASDKKPSDSN